MQDINSVTIVGRIVKDLDDKSYRTIGNGTACAKVSLAVNRSVKKDNQWIDEASFIDVTIWGKTAENLRPYLTKGTQIAVLGFLKQDRWQDKQSGQTRSSLGVVADNVQLLGGKKNTSGGNSQPARQGYAPQQGNGNFNPADGFPEDVPF